MAYDERIEARVKKIVSNWKNTDAKRMFGGICHLLNGKMFCGVYKNFLILRLGEKDANNALDLPYVKPFDITGRPMKGWVMVESEGFVSDDELKTWLTKAKQYVKSLSLK